MLVVSLQLFRYDPNSLGIGSSMEGRGQPVLQIISLNTLVDVISVPKARTSGK